MFLFFEGVYVPFFRGEYTYLRCHNLNKIYEQKKSTDVNKYEQNMFLKKYERNMIKKNTDMNQK